jgi:hypothetical protein
MTSRRGASTSLTPCRDQDRGQNAAGERRGPAPPRVGSAALTRQPAGTQAVDHELDRERGQRNPEDLRQDVDPGSPEELLDPGRRKECQIHDGNVDKDHRRDCAVGDKARLRPGQQDDGGDCARPGDQRDGQRKDRRVMARIGAPGSVPFAPVLPPLEKHVERGQEEQQAPGDAKGRERDADEKRRDPLPVR